MPAPLLEHVARGLPDARRKAPLSAGAEGLRHGQVHVRLWHPGLRIARVLGITPPTLRKYFAAELDTGHIEANAKVAQSLYKKATGDGPGATVAAIFWLKCRAGWREAMSPEPLGKKEQAQILAHSAQQGTKWDELLQ